MSIVCVAIIGKENDPLYIRTWLENVDVPAPLPGQIAADPSLKFHYHVHTSLDVIEERVNPHRRVVGAALSNAAAAGELYLGQLFSVEEYRLFGYITNTKIKFVVVVHETAAADISLRQWCRDLHGLYISTLCNPFFQLNSSLNAHPTFDFNVQKHVRNVQGRLAAA